MTDSQKWLSLCFVVPVEVVFRITNYTNSKWNTSCFLPTASNEAKAPEPLSQVEFWSICDEKNNIKPSILFERSCAPGSRDETKVHWHNLKERLLPIALEFRTIPWFGSIQRNSYHEGLDEKFSYHSASFLSDYEIHIVVDNTKNAISGSYGKDT